MDACLPTSKPKTYFLTGIISLLSFVWITLLCVVAYTRFSLSSRPERLCTLFNHNRVLLFTPRDIHHSTASHQSANCDITSYHVRLLYLRPQTINVTTEIGYCYGSGRG